MGLSKIGIYLIYSHNVFTLSNALHTKLTLAKRGSVKYHPIHNSDLMRVPILRWLG